MQEGIYFGMPAAEYHAAPGLSHSGMLDLGVSPLRYWHRHINPARPPEEPTPAMRLGTAIHAAILEPSAFRARYAKRLDRADYPDALDTIDDLVAWLAARDQPTKHKRKADLVERVRQCDPTQPVWQDLVSRHARESAGKELLAPEDWAAAEDAARTVHADPAAQEVLSAGEAEVSFFVRDPESGVMLKARMDHVSVELTVDLKSFSNTRNKETGQAIRDAIYERRYYEQAVFYHDVRELARRRLAEGSLGCYGDFDPSFVEALGRQSRHGFAFVFVESGPPFELALTALRRAPEPGGPQPHLYWTVARQRQRELIALYQECQERHGAEPWRSPLEVQVLDDTDMPRLAYKAESLPGPAWGAPGDEIDPADLEAMSA
jgi:hypothetical protein